MQLEYIEKYLEIFIFSSFQMNCLIINISKRNALKIIKKPNQNSSNLKISQTEKTPNLSSACFLIASKYFLFLNWFFFCHKENKFLMESHLSCCWRKGEKKIPPWKKAHANKVKRIVLFYESNLKQPETIFSISNAHILVVALELPSHIHHLDRTELHPVDFSVVCDSLLATESTECWHWIMKKTSCNHT